MPSDFTFRDGERLIRFGAGALDDAPQLLKEHGFDRYALLTTERLKVAAPQLVSRADRVIAVPSGPVPEAAASVRDQVAGRPVVAFGGGRVIDSGKAIAGADGVAVAAVPTTLSGAPFTPFHRMPAGVDEWKLVRPRLVVAAPNLMASMRGPKLAATAMNSLAHAMESLYTPLANPVSEVAALRAVDLYGSTLPHPEPDRHSLALASFLAGYAVGVAGLAVHHAVCQTVVRVAGTPHAETNAVMLPHFARLMANRAPRAMGLFARSLGERTRDPAGGAERVAALAAMSGVTTLGELGVEHEQLQAIAAAAASHPGTGSTPDPPRERELLDVLERAL